MLPEKAKENWSYEQCRKMEKMERLGWYDQVYAKAKELDDKKVSNTKGKGIRNNKGRVVSDSKEVTEVWVDYIQDLYGKPSSEIEILLSRLENKAEENTGEDQFGFRRN